MKLESDQTDSRPTNTSHLTTQVDGKSIKEIECILVYDYAKTKSFKYTTNIFPLSLPATHTHTNSLSYTPDTFTLCVAERLGL